MTGSLGGLLLRMAVSLGVVLALLWAVARVVTRRGGGPRLSGQRAEIAVLARAPLGRAASVAVVQTCGRTLVLGLSGQEVSVLASDDAPLVLADPPPSPSGRTPLATGWKPVLDALRERTVRRR